MLPDGVTIRRCPRHCGHRHNPWSVLSLAAVGSAGIDTGVPRISWTTERTALEAVPFRTATRARRQGRAAWGPQPCPRIRPAARVPEYPDAAPGLVSDDGTYTRYAQRLIDELVGAAHGAWPDCRQVRPAASKCVGCCELTATRRRPHAPARSPAISSNCSSAARRSSAISVAMTSGSGRLEASSWLSSFSQTMSRLALSRWISSA